jgi:chemotaxis protein CheX
MKAQHINPFIDSVSELFESMLDCPAHAGKIGLSDDKQEDDPYIIGLIGLSGTAKGIISIKLPEETARKVIGRMVGMEFDEVDSTVIDGVGELVNIIAGNAKSKFEGHSISLSLPSVVRGNLYKLQNIGKMVWLSLPFESELGNFFIEISFKSVVDWEKEVIDASAGS